ncbi:saccharopine dehydrogenase family protein [Orrella dioscoreae]|uniref:Carboxynorspermidine dehydrogenase, putative n=1 Tax=Orrella dioscoreae TaxID=1851544 RepID=A0A1C3JZI5_9BURK|nr:saccharopine dehydrogenase family protein [Orrella dioscoreae]SBT24672.1 Carboxynorspermidine dehydrogenase, putative [Orrella dioscoreae]SOE50370.1 Carboxynorspermidine dehydrogenase, putative [Orrella dioscoreae]
MTPNLLIIGAGGVAHVVAHKCAQHNDRLGEIHIASRTLEKCQAIVASVHTKGSLRQPGVLHAHALDAMDIDATEALIRETAARIVINVGSAFLNMSVLEACLRTGAAYLDTAIHEEPDRVCEAPPWYANHEWKRREACAAAGVTAILGAGFDPGVVNAYARLACDDYFDRVDSIDIVDINAGKHGRYFATNFDPEVNFREFTGTVWSWQGGQWTAAQMFEYRKEWDLPVVGRQSAYLTGHDELHSLSQHLDVPDIRFWMGFGEHYINVFTVLKNLGMLSEQPVRTAEGQEVVPLKVLKAVLPDPASLAPTYAGKTCIGNLVRGEKDGRAREIFVYNVCDHADSYREIGSQAISYTAGVPAAAAALLIADGTWRVGRMANIEQLPPRPFLSLLASMGLETWVREDGRDMPLAALADSVDA